MQQIPVYAFTGFLDSGKTKFIQETLEDPRFNAGERTLLLIFEEGEEEPEFIEPPRRGRLTRAERSERQKMQQLDPIEQRSAPVVKSKGIKGYVFLAVLEILGILLVMGWWLQWLI